MLKKELRDTLRVLLESALLLLGIPITILITWITGLDVPSLELIYGIFWVTVVAFSGYSGITLFQTEKRDRGFEYMLTLPVSRLKIFLYKYLPRLAILVLLIVALVTLSGFSYKLMFPPLFLQAGMVCLSLAFQTYFSGFIAFVLLGFLYNLMEKFSFVALFRLGGNDYDILHYIKPEIGAMLLIGIPLLISFVKVFKNYDLRPHKYVIKHYYYIAYPVLAVEFVVIFSLFRFYAYLF